MITRQTVGWLAVGLAVAVLAVAPATGALSRSGATVLGIVEGTTEFLPISSTGHLLIAERFLGFDRLGTSLDTYTIAIQLGAIAAVAVAYRQHIGDIMLGFIGQSRSGRTLLLRLGVVFVPAAIVGVAVGDIVKQKLFGPWRIVFAWAVGGIVLLLWRPKHGTTRLEHTTTRQAAVIGAAQLAAFWPGTSRSLVTLISGLAIGLTIAAAIEFSFLLGLVTLVPPQRSTLPSTARHCSPITAGAHRSSVQSLQSPWPTSRSAGSSGTSPPPAGLRVLPGCHRHSNRYQSCRWRVVTPSGCFGLAEGSLTDTQPTNRRDNFAPSMEGIPTQ